MKMKKNKDAILLINCPDRQGISATVANFLYKNCGNIIDIDQHVDKIEKIYFLRVRWDLDGFLIPRDKIASIFENEIATKFNMSWSLFLPKEKLKTAIFVSKYGHCLYDILSTTLENNWDMEVCLILSNHKDMKSSGKIFGVDYFYTNFDDLGKEKAEDLQLKKLKEYKIEFVILARYMQILSKRIVSEFENRIINIHHSFLPAFPGARPYYNAYLRGVKIIGATAHYVSTDLDEGPIISQDVIRVSNSDSVSDMIRKGKNLEKVVLSDAIWKHINRKIMVYKNRTVIF